MVAEARALPSRLNRRAGRVEPNRGARRRQIIPRNSVAHGRPARGNNQRAVFFVTVQIG